MTNPPLLTEAELEEIGERCNEDRALGVEGMDAEQCREDRARLRDEVVRLRSQESALVEELNFARGQMSSSREALATERELHRETKQEVVRLRVEVDDPKCHCVDLICQIQRNGKSGESSCEIHEWKFVNEHEALRTQLAEANADRERMDWLEQEQEREQSIEYWPIFRRNVVVTRAAIDAARRDSGEGGEG